MPSRNRLIYTPLAIAPLIALADQWGVDTFPAPEDWRVFTSAEDMAQIWARLDRVVSTREAAFARLVADAPTQAAPAVPPPSPPEDHIKPEAAAVLDRLRRGAAHHMLDASMAVVQATKANLPLRFVLSEVKEGGATLSFLPPVHVFAPYVNEVLGLAKLAMALEAEFETIVRTTLLSDDPKISAV